MPLSRILLHLSLFLSPVALLATTWLYRYPVFQSCAFPTPSRTHDADPHPLPAYAPFTLLALGDPQLEGDSSLPNPDDPIFPSLESLFNQLREQQSLGERYSILQNALRDSVTLDIPKFLKAKRKQLDLWGNDYYLAHVYRTLHWWTQPTHISVLGDLLGSQWVSDDEFSRRGDRFWNRVFKGAERVPETIMREYIDEEGEDGSDGVKGPWEEVLGQEEAWNKRIINIAGNHDVGYAGDLNEERVARFERVFGLVNWEITFTLPNATTEKPPSNEEGRSYPPALRLIILNSMNLDTGAQSPTHQSETYSFLNHVITSSRPVEDRTISTILLTHIPLHKESGICVDDPVFDFYDDGRVKEQNHLSDHASKGILEGMFGLSGDENAPGGGMGRLGVVVNGHDHEGCDVLHYFPRTGQVAPSISEDTSQEEEGSNEERGEEEKVEAQWKARRLGVRGASVPSVCSTNAGDVNLTSTPHLREITLRSMMGEYGGYAGLLSAWFDPTIGEHGEWRMEFASCSLGVQHWWWGVHVLDVITLGVLVVGVMLWCVEGTAKKAERKEKGETGGKARENGSVTDGPRKSSASHSLSRKEARANLRQIRRLESMEAKAKSLG